MATQLMTTREERGQTIAQYNGQIKRIDENFYSVKSQSGNGEYAVTKIDQEWIYECPITNIAIHHANTFTPLISHCP